MLRLFIFCACFLMAQSSMAGSLSWVSQDRWVTVKHVTDGDTFKTTQGEKVRLLGINTPETRKDTSPAQPFGRKAKQALQKMIASKQVRLVFDKEKKDQYGRTLAHVYTRGGLWVNAEMLRQGLAHVYTFVPNTTFAKRLVSIEQQAIQQKKGIWSHKRWRVLGVNELDVSLLGQFRLIHGTLTKRDKSGWRFYLDKLAVSIPKKYRKGFRRGHHLQVGDEVLVRGKLRMSKKKQWFLSIHSPSDVSHIN